MSSPSSLIHLVCYGAGFLGGICLLVAPFLEKGRQAAHWIRVALWLSGAAGVLWSLLGGIILSGNALLSTRAIIVASQAKTVLSGVGIGLLILLFASGEFVRAFASGPKEASK